MLSREFKSYYRVKQQFSVFAPLLYFGVLCYSECIEVYMTTQQPQMGLTFDQVWASLMKVSEQQEKIAELMKQTDEKMKQTDEQMKQTDEQMKRTDKRIGKALKRIDKVTKNVGGLNRSMGELIETLIAAKLWEKFDAYHLNRAYQRMPIFDESAHILTDIDILLLNDEYVMAVEVKRELNRTKEVDRHLKRMELILKYPPDQCKGKKLLGAIAGGVVDPDTRDYAHSVGFFVLELAGESVRLVEAPADFTPRQW
jgi:hypothetical protein